MTLLILDKDNTLVTPKSGEKFVQNPEDQVLIPGVKEALSGYKQMGWSLAIASNQGGVASSHKTLNSALDEMIYAMEMTGIEYAMFAHSYERRGYGEAVFVDRTDGGLFWKVVKNVHSRFRKPAGGMIDYLCTRMTGINQWNDGRSVLYVGDRPEDEGAASAVKAQFLWAHDWLKRNPLSNA